MSRTRLVIASALMWTVLSGVSKDLAGQTLDSVLTRLQSQFTSLDTTEDPCPLEPTYRQVAVMQEHCNEADRSYAAMAANGTATPNDAETLVRIHAIMKAAAIKIAYPDLVDLHERFIRRYMRDAGHVVTGDSALLPLLDGAGASFRERYQFWEDKDGNRRRESSKAHILLDKSRRPEGINDLVVKRVGTGASPCDPARLFADSFTLQLSDPIAKNSFIKYFLDEAEKLGIDIRLEDYLASPSDRKGTADWIRAKAEQFAAMPEIALRSGIAGEPGYFYIPPGEYVLYVGDRANASGRSLQIPEALEPTQVLRYRWQIKTPGFVTVDLLEGPKQPFKLGPPEFRLADFRIGTDNQAGGLQGAVGAQMFQRFGGALALQTQGEFEFRKHQDLMDLDQVLANIPSQYLPREQRDLFDYSAREFQLDIGPVVRVKQFQFAAMQSLRYIKRDTWDKGGYVGQFFFNAGYLFKYGQVGLFATKANIDEPVVKTVQFDEVLFEETYLRVADQYGVNFQFGLGNNSRIGHFEGSAGYIKLATADSALGGNLRYIHPLPISQKRLAITAEVGYNEGFIRSTENNLRVGVGLRFGNWARPSEFASTKGAVPVIVPRIRYETLTRVVRRGNRRPVADAGPDQVDVDWRNGQVILDGSGSYDPDGDTLTYQWTQEKGPLVELQGATTASPRFTPANAEEYIFTLVVTDSFGAKSDPDSVRVTTIRVVQPKILDFRVDNAIYRTPGCQGSVPPTLFWKVQDASRITISNTSIDKPATAPVDEGQVQVNPTQTITYTLTAFNLVNESVTATATVTVRPCLPVILSFTANPAEIREGGNSVLSWQVESADKLRLTNDGTSQDLTGDSLTVTPSVTTVYTLTAYNSAGEIVSADVTVTVKAALPVIKSFTATPPEIRRGDSSVLAWVVEDADKITLTNNGGSQEIAASGSLTVTPTQTTVYTLTAFNTSGESVTAQVTVTVKDQLPRIISFTATPSEIRLGQSSVLAWVVEDADKITLSNVGIAEVTGSGSLTVTPAQTTVYSLTAFNTSGESVTAQVTVTVKGELPRIISFTATPPEIRRGQSSVLAWVVENADRVTLTNAGGQLPPASPQAVSPTQTTVYTLTAFNKEGESVSADVTVTVKPALLVIRSFSADPPEIQVSQSSTLSWDIENTDDNSKISLTNGPSSLPPTASLVVTPAVTTTYTLTACNSIGECTSASVTVTVRELPVINSFRATPPAIDRGQESIISWDVTGASAVSITNLSVGSTEFNGTRVVKPEETTAYTLTACNVRGDCVSASLTVTVTLAPVIRFFTATPPEVLRGETSRLSWQTQNASRVTLTNGNASNDADVDPSGSLDVTPDQTTTYTLTACNAAGTCVSATATVTVTVPPVIISFTAVPAEILQGETSRLTWQTENASRVSLTNGNAGDDAEVDPSGSLDVTPNQTTTYTLTACNPAGTCVSATATVTVKTAEPPVPDPVIAFFRASPEEIQQDGESQLSWEVRNATRVTIDQAGFIAPPPAPLPNPYSASIRVRPEATTTYILTACNSEDVCVSATARVTVVPLAVPRILYFQADPPQIEPGDFSRLFWKVEGTSTVIITNLDQPNQPAENPPNGYLVSPAVDTTYTLAACNASGQCVSANVTVIVRPPVPSINTFTASPEAIASGGSSTLSWDVAVASRVTLTGGGIDSNVPLQGTRIVTPVVTTTYTLTAHGEGGDTDVRQVTVVVSGP